MASSFHLAQPATFAALPLHSRTAKTNVRSHAMRDRNSIDNQISAQDFFESFLRERQSKSDFISRASDVLWRKEVFDVDEEKLEQVRKRLEEFEKMKEDDNSGGFLKLSQTKQWGLGIDDAPTNARLAVNGADAWQDDYRRIGFLEYAALKREISLLTAAVAAVGTVYCGVIISSEAALSYAIGALGSLLYLKLLSRYVDQLSEEDVPEAFTLRKKKTIGIRSGDIQDAFAKLFLGSGFSLASPRLLIPVSLYGLSALLYRFTDMQLNLEMPPMMFGFFAYKGALLLQAYRDNKDLAMDFETNNKSVKQ